MKIKVSFDDIEIVEVKKNDIQGISEIAREIAIDSTKTLFKDFRDKKINESEMKEYKMEKLARIFKEILKKNKLHLIERINEKYLFTPYGKLKYPFKNNAKKYYIDAIRERKDKIRNTYRLIIKEKNKHMSVVGGFVFDTYPDSRINTTGRIGDIGIFFKPGKEHRYLCKTIYSMFRILNKIINEHVFRLENEGKGFDQGRFIVDATAHPFNFKSIDLLSSEKRLGFAECPQLADCEYGIRKKFEIRYSTLIKIISEKIISINLMKKYENECKFTVDGKLSNII